VVGCMALREVASSSPRCHVIGVALTYASSTRPILASESKRMRGFSARTESDVQRAKNRCHLGVQDTRLVWDHGPLYSHSVKVCFVSAHQLPLAAMSSLIPSTCVGGAHWGIRIIRQCRSSRVESHLLH
jgi:hypothetical protein